MKATAFSSTFIGVLLISRGASAQVVADHLAVDRFEAIPESALRSAAALRLMFRHASVGGTIGDGLDCVQGTRENPSECRLYPDYAYDRRNWSFQPRGNSGWYAKVDDFVAETESQLASFDAFSFKYCYLDGLDGLMEPCGSPQDPAKVDRAWEYLRDHMEALEAAHSDKIFIWWTIPLTQVGQSCTEVLNERIRRHARDNGKILFDIADIESHDLQGAPHTSAEGWEAALGEFCGEQQPGAQACHPNWTGKIRLAMAFWWLMARASGWEDGAGERDFLRGNADGDEGMDITDAVFLLSHLFIDGAAPDCEKAADANDDGSVDLSDAIRILYFLFDGRVPMPEPFSVCGRDLTQDTLSCSSYLPCGL